MRPLTQVQNPKQARWFPVNSTIRAVSTLAARSFRLPVYKRPSYQSGLQIARFANSARSRFGDDALARGWRSNRPQMGCVSWARLSGLVSSDEAAVGEQCTPCDPSGAVGSKECDKRLLYRRVWPFGREASPSRCQIEDRRSAKLSWASS